MCYVGQKKMNEHFPAIFTAINLCLSMLAKSNYYAVPDFFFCIQLGSMISPLLGRDHLQIYMHIY